MQEFYVDDDVDEGLRSQVEADTGNALADLDYQDVVDGAILWWRSDDAADDDLVDVLVDAAANLDDGGGLIWVLTPKSSRGDAVPVSDVEEAAKTCGLRCTSSTSVGEEWMGIRLVSRPRVRERPVCGWLSCLRLVWRSTGGLARDCRDRRGHLRLAWPGSVCLAADVCASRWAADLPSDLGAVILYKLQIAW